MFDQVWSDDPSIQLQSATFIRMHILSQLTNIASVAEDVIATGVVPRLVQFLYQEGFPRLQFEAAWTLRNIATARPDVVIQHGTVPIFVTLLASRRHYVRQQAIWGLGNVACHLITCNYILECGALTPLLRLLYNDTKLSILIIGTWTLLNLCQCPQPLTFFNEVAPALELLLHSNNETVLKYACLALLYLSYGSIDGIQRLIEAGFVPRLVELLQHPSPLVLGPALINIGNIVSRRDHQQTQFVINHGVLTLISNLLTPTYESSVKTKACWTISDITAGTKEQIQSVIDENLIPILVNLAQNAELNTKRAVVSAILHVTSCGSHDQIKYMVEQSCIKTLCDMLVCPDLEIILMCLDGLENILMAGETAKIAFGYVNCYDQLIKDAEGLQKIENLKCHKNQEIHEKALKILRTYGLKRINHLMRSHTI